MDETDAEISAAMIRLQTAIAGIPVETALNAISIQLGVLAILGADDKRGALAVVRNAAVQARQTANRNWGKPEIEVMRRLMRGETVQ